MDNPFLASMQLQPNESVGIFIFFIDPICRWHSIDPRFEDISRYFNSHSIPSITIYDIFQILVFWSIQRVKPTPTILPVYSTGPTPAFFGEVFQLNLGSNHRITVRILTHP